MSRDPKRTITDGVIYDTLQDVRGNVSRAALLLSMRRGILYDRIMKTPDLCALLQDYREALVDTAEDNTRADVEKGDPQASRFILQTLGKDRGYTTGVVGSGKGGAIVVELRSFDGGTDA